MHPGDKREHVSARVCRTTESEKLPILRKAGIYVLVRGRAKRKGCWTLRKVDPDVISPVAQLRSANPDEIQPAEVIAPEFILQHRTICVRHIDLLVCDTHLA